MIDGAIYELIAAVVAAVCGWFARHYSRPRA